MKKVDEKRPVGRPATVLDPVEAWITENARRVLLAPPPKEAAAALGMTEGSVRNAYLKLRDDGKLRPIEGVRGAYELEE